PDAITDRVAQHFRLEGIKSTITTACSSSANAMGYAHDAIAAGFADVMLTGGSDVLARLTYAGFNSLRSVDPDPCRPFDRERKGLSFGAVSEVSRHPVITGSGAVCALGRSPGEFYRRLLAGETAIRPMTREER